MIGDDDDDDDDGGGGGCSEYCINGVSNPIGRSFLNVPILLDKVFKCSYPIGQGYLNVPILLDEVFLIFPLYQVLVAL